MREVQDTFIQPHAGSVGGYIHTNRLTCGVCGQPTMCIVMNRRPSLPDYIEKDDAKILFHQASQSPHPQDKSAYGFIGIGCGCYARAHRQIAHIAHQRSYE